MTVLQKRLLIVIGILTACMVFLATNLYMALNINGNQLYVRYQTIKDSAIPEDLGIVSIVYFTDLQYGTYETDERTEKLIETIKELDPSLVIFGGDLYDDAFTPSTESNQKLISYLNEIEAPLGKFAVWGEKDIDEVHNASVREIYAQTGFEVLENRQVQVGNESQTGFTLCGLTLDSDASVLANNTADSFHLVVSHYPDVLANNTLTKAQISLALTGNAHGTQITYPFIGGYKEVEGSLKLNRAKQISLSFPIVLSSGVGNTDIDVRWNADPEIHYFLLSHK